ncbi:MAG: DUF4426 domain-containing protein [Gammaproteobacteria bacterium]|nr:DUF4426 domain-containing protein [Gammaproteobacteria bacterium]
MRSFLSLVVILLVAGITFAEQSVEFDDWTVHYSVIPSTFISKEIAEKHKIVRGKDRAVCNISVVDPDGNSYEAKVSGGFKNLMGQDLKLNFKTIKESEAVYFLASFKFTEGEKLKFEIEVEFEEHEETVKFEQEVYSRLDDTN